MRTPFWFRIVVLVILIAVLLTALFLGASKILDIWAAANP
jgi:hypothetical protein